MSEPITSNCLPPDSSVCDPEDQTIIVAIYSLDGEKEKLIDYITFSNTTANALKSGNLVNAWLQDKQAPGSYVIRSGIGFLQDNGKPFIDSVWGEVKFRTGGER